MNTFPEVVAIASKSTKIDAGLLVYNEQNGRVSDTSFKSVASRLLDDDDKINVSFLLVSSTQIQSIQHPILPQMHHRLVVLMVSELLAHHLIHLMAADWAMSL